MQPYPSVELAIPPHRTFKLGKQWIQVGSDTLVLKCGGRYERDAFLYESAPYAWGYITTSLEGEVYLDGSLAMCSFPWQYDTHDDPVEIRYASVLYTWDIRDRSLEIEIDANDPNVSDDPLDWMLKCLGKIGVNMTWHQPVDLLAAMRAADYFAGDPTEWYTKRLPDAEV